MISIFLDTNILFSRSKDFTIAGFRENLENIIAEIEVNDVYDKVQIVIPRLVLEELKMQQFEAHSELAAKFKNVRFTNQAIEISHDYYSKVCDIFSAAEEEIVQSSTVTVLYRRTSSWHSPLGHHQACNTKSASIRRQRERI